MKLPLKTLLVENLVPDLEVLKKRLLKYPDFIEISRVAMTFNEAKNILQFETFDLSILDIDLDEYDCFRLVDEVGREKFGIIALNTISESVLGNKAEKIGQYFWLPKPYSNGSISEFIEKLRASILVTETQKKVEPKNELLEYIKKIHTHLNDLESKIKITKETKEAPILENNYFLYNEKKKHLKIYHDQILFVHGARNTQQIVCRNEIKGYQFLPITDTLDNIYSKLDHEVFYFCQKSYIVNIKKVIGCDPVELIVFFGIDPLYPQAKFTYNFPDFISFLKEKRFLE